MATDKKVIVLRASKDEEPMIDFLTDKFGMSMSRVLGLAVRRLAEQEGYKAEPGKGKENENNRSETLT